MMISISSPFSKHSFFILLFVFFTLFSLSFVQESNATSFNSKLPPNLKVILDEIEKLLKEADQIRAEAQEKAQLYGGPPAQVLKDRILNLFNKLKEAKDSLKIAFSQFVGILPKFMEQNADHAHLQLLEEAWTGLKTQVRSQLAVMRSQLNQLRISFGKGLVLPLVMERVKKVETAMKAHVEHAEQHWESLFNHVDKKGIGHLVEKVATLQCKSCGHQYHLPEFLKLCDVHHDLMIDTEHFTSVAEAKEFVGGWAEWANRLRVKCAYCEGTSWSDVYFQQELKDEL